MLERMWRYNYLFYCNVRFVIKSGILLSVILYIASAYRLFRISTTDVCITLPPNFRQARGYPHISGQNIKLVTIILLLTSHFMFWTFIMVIKKMVW